MFGKVGYVLQILIRLTYQANFIKIANNRTEKQGKVSFLFKILLFLQKKAAARQLKQVS